jgi:uncharacterized surface protein with fasciclin (FAS1) repeats
MMFLAKENSVMESKNNMAAAAIALVLGLAVGGFGGYMLGGSMTDKKDDSMNSSQASTSESKEGVMVGGALMVRDKDIVDNAVEADNVTTVVSLVKLAGLVDTLKSDGPFTVFAPNNDAFAKIDKATVESLQKPENVETLKTVLTYHVVPGTYTSAALKVMAEKGETLTSVQGQVLKPVLDGGKVWIEDAMGGKSAVQTADVISSNGVTHVIESVLMPKS